MDQSSLLFTLIIFMILFDLVVVIALLGIYASLRRMTASVERQRANFEEKITPIVTDVKQRLDQAQVIFENLQKTTDNFVQVSEIVRAQAEKVEQTLQETADRARVQIAKVDEVISDVVEKIHITSVVVQQNILAPVREISAILRGISGAAQLLFGRRRPAVDRVHQDEELFI